MSGGLCGAYDILTVDARRAFEGMPVNAICSHFEWCVVCLWEMHLFATTILRDTIPVLIRRIYICRARALLEA